MPVCGARGFPLTALSVAAAVAAGRLSARSVVEECLDRIAAHDDAIGAFNFVLADEAMAAADGVDGALARGEPVGPLAGVPVAVKDNMCTRGVPTTCSSRMLENWRPPYDATAVQRLRAAGAVVIGKTNLDEFAMGSSTENSAFGPTRNPHDTSRVPGGSSGGSTAAVAAGFAPSGSGLRHRRIGAPAGGALRRGGTEAHLRNRVALRTGGVRIVARPGRTHSRRCRRRRCPLRGDSRTRPARLHLHPPAGPACERSHARRSGGHEDRRARRTVR